MNYWWTADYHFSHFNIIRYCERPFKTAEEMQKSATKIMGKIYQFKYLFVVGINIFSFPYLLFFLRNIKPGWRMWYRRWRQSIIRFAAWITIKKWAKEFKKSDFSHKLWQARKRLSKI